MFRREILTAPFCQIYVNIFSMGDKVGTVYESILPGRFTEQNSQGPDVKFQSARKVGSSTCCRTLLKCFFFLARSDKLHISTRYRAKYRLCIKMAMFQHSNYIFYL